MREQDISDAYEYDVALSFAGEDRAYVEKAARLLKERGVRVFYDRYEEVELWGKDLYTHLDDVYRNKARYCIIFVSKHYREKLWTNHERESAQARAFTENEEYILPARFDDTEIPGIRPAVGYIPLRNVAPQEFVELVCQKVGLPEPTNIMPLIPVGLFEEFGARDESEQKEITAIAHYLFSHLKLMDQDERRFVFYLFKYGCPAALPENIHIDLNYLRRLSGWSRQKIRKIIERIECLAFSADIVEDTRHTWAGRPRSAKSYLAKMEVHCTAVDIEAGNITGFLDVMVSSVTEGYCSDCAPNIFCRLDFSALGRPSEID